METLFTLVLFAFGLAGIVVGAVMAALKIQKNKHRVGIIWIAVSVLGFVLLALTLSGLYCNAYDAGVNASLGQPATALPIGGEYRVMHAEEINNETYLTLVDKKNVITFFEMEGGVGVSEKDWIESIATSNGTQLKHYPYEGDLQ